MGSNAITCLYGLGEHLHLKVIDLSGLNKVCLGRAESNEVVLGESRAVSRQHARLDKTAAEGDDSNSWSITDLNSGNGVYINNEKITPAVARPLQDRDLIDIGRDPTTNQPAPYRFQFYVKAKVQVQKPDETPSVQDKTDPVSNPVIKGSLKRLSLSNISNIPPSPSALIRVKLSEQERRLKEEFMERQREYEEKMEQLQRELEEKENSHKQSLEELQKKQDSLTTELNHQKVREKAMLSEQSHREQELNSLLTASGDKMAALQGQLDALQSGSEETVAELAEIRELLMEELAAKKELEMELDKEKSAQEQKLLTAKKDIEDKERILSELQEEKTKLKEGMESAEERMKGELQTKMLHQENTFKEEMAVLKETCWR